MASRLAYRRRLNSTTPCAKSRSGARRYVPSKDDFQRTLSAMTTISLPIVSASAFAVTLLSSAGLRPSSSDFRTPWFFHRHSAVGRSCVIYCAEATTVSEATRLLQPLFCHRPLYHSSTVTNRYRFSGIEGSRLEGVGGRRNERGRTDSVGLVAI